MNRAQSCSGLNPPPKAAAQEFEENRPPPRNPASFPQSSHDPNSRRQHRSLPPRSRLPTSRELQDLPPESARPPEARGRSRSCLTVRKIGRASCRERVCQYVSISVVVVSLEQKYISDYMTSHTFTNLSYNTDLSRIFHIPHLHL